MVSFSEWLPSGGGEMGERIRSFDWTSHPLGSPEHWPVELHAALGICLNSSFPTAIYWGRDLWLIYNDAWSAIPRDRHPWAFGRSGKDVWTDIWDVVGPQFAEVLTDGTGVTSYDQMLPMERDGHAEETYWNYSLTPIVDRQGTPVGIFNQGHEVTDKVLAARARNAETERLRELFSQAPGAIAVLRGKAHVFEIANRAYLELIGQPGDVVGRPVAEVLPEVVGQGFLNLLDRVYEAGEPYLGKSVPVELMRQGVMESRIVDFVYHPTRDLAGHIDGVFVEAWDVTEHQHVLEEMKHLNATLEQRVETEVAERMQTESQLRQAQKMEAIGQLTGGIAHDFNNMLAVIISAMNLLRRRIDAGDRDVGRFVDAATESAERAAGLTRRLLAFSRQQSLQPQALDPNSLIMSMREILDRTLGERIEIITAQLGASWHISADPSQLENALLNLAVNARDAMPGGGQLSIETGDILLGAAEAGDFDLRPGQYVRLSVADTGTGMTPDLIARAFDPFFTTKDVGKGTGLGLSQILGFVRQSSGHVELQSEPGQGTTVTIYLPRAEAAAERAEPKTGPRHLRAGDGETVLVVEDELRVREFSIEALQDLGYTVTGAATGEEALKLIESGATPDLIFSDIVMPEMNGPELARHARLLHPLVKILFTTGYAPETVMRGHDELASAHIIHKPFTIEQLALKIRDVLDEAEAGAAG